jgi:hypothetical protein
MKITEKIKRFITRKYEPKVWAVVARDLVSTNQRVALLIAYDEGQARLKMYEEFKKEYGEKVSYGNIVVSIYENKTFIVLLEEMDKYANLTSLVKEIQQR